MVPVVVFIDKFVPEAIDFYADVLESVARALASRDLDSAEMKLRPISGELWRGKVSTSRSSTIEPVDRVGRSVSEQTRANVFLRDSFYCSHCGGRGLSRCVMVAISDVFPEMFAYEAHYARERIHPAYWVLTLEADHTKPHARGGSGDEANLTAMHALCNTRKSATEANQWEAAEHAERRPSWDGLLSEYPGVVAIGETKGRRHSAPGYHRRWLKRFDLEPIGASSA